MESLTTEKKVIPSVVPVPPPLFVPEVHLAIPELPNFVAKPSDLPVDERSAWSGSKQKDKETFNEWESSSYNSSFSRTNSKNDDEVNRNSKKYYDKYEGRKERDRDFTSKYAYHRGEDYDRDRYRRERDKDKDRREYRTKDEWKEREKPRKDRDYYDYKDRYGYGAKSSTKTDNYRPESSTDLEYSTFESYNSKGSSASYKYGHSSSSSWAPPPPKSLPSPPRPPPEPPNDDEELNEQSLVSKDKSIDDGDSTVDLDTRIAMLFKSKSFGSDAPSLFQLDDDSENETNQDESASKEKEGTEDFDDSKDILEVDKRLNQNEVILKNIKLEDTAEDGELIEIKKDGAMSDASVVSSTPSPFESRTTFISNRKFYKRRKHKRSHAKIKVESGASDISSSEDDLLAKGSYSPPLPRKTLKDDDQMSLSSLSSTEPIKDEDLKNEPKFSDPTSSGSHPVAFSSYNAAYYYQNTFHQFQQPGQWMGTNETSTYYQNYKREPHYNIDDPHERAVKKVIDKLILELKQILKKDFNKRMIENTAYKKYEAWWDDQERNKNSRRFHDVNEIIQAPVKSPVGPSVSETSYQPSGSLGILRNLRFQRIKRDLVQQQEDSRKSDDDDVVYGSDSEKEETQQSSKTSFVNHSVIDSSSSESSESDESSSEDDDDEENEKEDHAYSSDTGEYQKLLKGTLEKYVTLKGGQWWIISILFMIEVEKGAKKSVTHYSDAANVYVSNRFISF